MDSKIIIFLASLSFLLCQSNAFNVTTMLDQFPNFSTFNNYLTQSRIAADINSRKTITVLAVDNGNAAALSGKSSEMIKRVMALHVVLDYYDVKKFQNLAKKSARLTTLFQSTGLASGDQGFLNATDMGGGSVMFGSAVQGSQLNSNLISSVTDEGYDISILQVSSLIIPAGFDSIAPSSTPPSQSPPPPPPPPSEGPTPAPAPGRKMLPPKNSPPSRAPPPPPSDEASPPAAEEESDTPAASPEAESDSTDSTASFGTAREACLGIIMAIISSNLFFFML